MNVSFFDSYKSDCQFKQTRNELKKKTRRDYVPKLAGTSLNQVYIGKKGPVIRNNSGSFQLRNNTDSAYVNLETNSIGVNTTPVVSVDINATDAIRVPVGTEAQRPTGANGMIRYNNDEAFYEGFVVNDWLPFLMWSNRAIDTYVGDGTNTNFILTLTPDSATDILVVKGDVVQEAGVDFTVTGTQILTQQEIL